MSARCSCPSRIDLEAIVVPKQQIRACIAVEATDGGDRIPRQEVLGPVLDAPVGDLPDKATRKIDASGCDIGASVAIEIRDDQAGDRTGQLVGQRLEAGRPAVTHMPVLAHAEDICFAVTIEIPEPQVRNPGTGSVKSLEHPDTAIGDIPMLTVGVEDVGAVVTAKIPDCGIAQERATAIDLFPLRRAAPRNIPVGTVLGEDIGAAITVEITEQKAADPVGLGIEEAPLGDACRGVVPGRAGGQEEVVFAIAVEIAHAKAARGIGCPELVIVNAKFPSAVGGGTDNRRIQGVAGVGDHHGRKMPERNVVMKLSQEAGFTAQFEILPVRGEECVPRNLHILPPAPAVTGPRYGGSPSAVHIKVLRIPAGNPYQILYRRIREDEVVPGPVDRVS